MSFPIFALLARGGIENLPHIQAWKKRVEMRPAGNEPSNKAGRYIPVKDEMLQIAHRR
jgi:glutathione S-transferase